MSYLYMSNFLTFQVHQAFFIPIYLHAQLVLYLPKFNKRFEKSYGRIPRKNKVLLLSGWTIDNSCAWSICLDLLPSNKGKMDFFTSTSSFLLNLYSLSPTIGHSISLACTRIWWVLPVSISQLTSDNFWFLPKSKTVSLI